MLSTRLRSFLLALAGLLLIAGPAGAATSQLTPSPPVPLSQTRATTTTTTVSSTTVSSVSAPARTTALPRTGMNVVAELFAAALLVGAGALLRLRRAPESG